jgi:hypothetical protein
LPVTISGRLLERLTVDVAALDIAGFPTALQLDPERVFVAFLDVQYGDSSASHWYLGFAVNCPQ